MENLNFNITKFDKRKAELYKLAENCKTVVINGVNDKTGYELADESRKILKKKRCELQKEFKQERAVSNVYSKAVLAMEKDIVGIIEPIERDIEQKQKIVDLEKQMIARKELTPERTEKLEEIEIKVEESFLLQMDNKEFDEYFNEKKTEYLEAKEKAVKEQEEKLKREKELEEARKKADKEAKEQAKREAELEKERVIKEREEAIRKAENDKQKAIEEEKRKAEEEKQKAVEEEKRKAEAEKQRIIDEQKKKEEERIAKEQEEKRAEEERIKAEKEEKEKLEKRKKYTNWLKKNGYTEDTKDQFKIINEDNKFTIYKKLDEIIIK